MDQELKFFFNQYLKDDKFENGKSTYDLFFEMQNEGFTKGSKFYFVKVQAKSIYHSTENTTGVLNIFGGVKNTESNNICNGNLNNSYLKGMIWKKKTTAKKYVNFVLLTPSQKQKYENYLSGNLRNSTNSNLITPVGILIVRLDKNFLHVSTICKQSFTDVREFIFPSQILKLLFKDLINMQLFRTKDKKTIEEEITKNKQSMDNIKNNPRSFDKQKINSIMKIHNLSRIEKVKFNKQIINEIYNHLDLQFTNNKLIDHIKVNIKTNIQEITRGIHNSVDKAKKLYNLELTQDIKNEIAYSFQMAQIGFNFILGMSDILGYQGLSLDSVPEQVGTYSRFGFIPHTKKAHEEFVGEGSTSNLTPMGVSKKSVVKYLSKSGDDNVIKCKKPNLDRLCEIPTSMLSVDFDLSQQMEDILVLPSEEPILSKKRYLKPSTKAINQKRKEKEENINQILQGRSQRHKEKELEKLLKDAISIGERIRIRNELKRLRRIVGIAGGGSIKQKGKKIYIILNKKKRKKKGKKKGGKKKGDKRKRKKNIFDEIFSFFF